MLEFLNYARETHPELLPKFSLPYSLLSEKINKAGQNNDYDVFHGTTVLGACYDKGVILAGDRRMTRDNGGISKNLADKICQIDSNSAVAYAGTMATCMNMAKIVRIAQNNYRKKNDCKPSLEGTAVFLGRLIEQNLQNAMQGLAFIPLLAGYEERGLIFSYDIAGGTYKNVDHAANGSGGQYASDVLEREWHPDIVQKEAISLVLDALQFSAAKDSATGGVKLGKNKILPTIYAIEKTGASRIDDNTIIEALGGDLYA